MKFRILLPVSAALLLAACGTTGPGPSVGPAPTVAASFDARDFAWSQARGRGRIDGQLALRRGGTSYRCPAAGVVLIPETPWVRERMQRLYRSTDRAVAPAEDVRERMPAQSPNYDAFVRKADCDSQERFSFAGLPDGAWYVITSGVASGGGVDMAIMRRVTIRGGQAVRVEL